MINKIKKIAIKSFKYTSYFITTLLLLAGFIFLLYLLIKRFEYLVIKFPNEASSFIGKFDVMEDLDEKEYYNNYSDVNKKDFYEEIKNENKKRVVSFSKSSSADSKYGTCKYGYFVLNYIDKKSACDEEDKKNGFCHLAFHSEYPAYLFNFTCSQDGPYYNLIMLKNKGKTQLWVEDEGFYFKLEKIK